MYDIGGGGLSNLDGFRVVFPFPNDEVHLLVRFFFVVSHVPAGVAEIACVQGSVAFLTRSPSWYRLSQRSYSQSRRFIPEAPFRLKH